MKKLLLLALAFLLPTFVIAAKNPYSSDDVYVSGHYKSNGKYVEPYYRSAPNANNWDNYNYKPSQPQYNDSYYQPNANTTPNPGRLNDNNPYNNAPSGGYYGQK
jgi:hypothetical protein